MNSPFKLIAISLLIAIFAPTGISFANTMPYKQTFIITGYYSPLPDQEHYVMGSFEADKRMNGNGTNGASGAEVFPGMIAAPKSYPFGFKIDIPGIGITEVQDRGGAIVNAGQRGYAHDRLDIWMGAGDIGLRRALLWGKRTVETTVYGVNDHVVTTATFDDWSHDELELVRYWKENAPSTFASAAKLFTRDLWLGESSEKVKELQSLLADLGYLFDDADGKYNDATARAVYQFQRDNDIVYTWDELGAGHFGPQTRATIEKAKAQLEEGTYVNQTAFLQEIQEHDDLAEEFTAFTNELYVGKTGDNVYKLQEELVSLGYLRLEPTGTYDEVTENAVMRFQLKKGIIADKDSHGSGVVGPKTRAALNLIFDDRIEAKGMIASKRGEAVPATLMIAEAK